MAAIILGIISRLPAADIWSDGVWSLTCLAQQEMPVRFRLAPPLRVVPFPGAPFLILRLVLRAFLGAASVTKGHGCQSKGARAAKAAKRTADGGTAGKEIIYGPILSDGE